LRRLLHAPQGIYCISIIGGKARADATYCHISPCVSRGEPRCTFPNDWLSLRLLSLAIAQVEEFTADTFFALAQTIDLGSSE
jgi:hypothetical protein